MSWFGDGFSQLKGQLSSFAKVLVEDADSANENDPGSILVGGSSQSNQETNAEEVRRPRRRQASEGWTDVQLQPPSYHDEIDNVESKPFQVSTPASEEASSPVNIVQTQATPKSVDKDVGSILRGGFATLIQKGKEQFEPLSPSKIRKCDQETQTDPKPEPEAFSVHDRIVSNLQQTIHTLNQQNERLRNDVTRLTNELEAQAAASQDENANLSTGMEELDMQHQRAIEHILEVKEEALKEYEVLKVRHASLEDEVAELRRKAASAEEAAAISNSLLKTDLAEELEQRDREVECLESENASLRDAIKELTAQLDRSRDTLPTVMEEPDDQGEEVASLKARVKELEDEIRLMEDESVQAVEVLRKTNGDLKSQLTSKNEEIEKLSSELNRFEEKCEGLEWETEELRAKVDCAKSTANELQNLKANLEEASKKAAETDKLKSELAVAMKAENLVAELNAELGRFKSQEAEITELRAALEASKVNETLISELNAKLEEANRQSQELLSKVKDLEANLQEAKFDNTKSLELKNELDRLKNIEKEAEQLKADLEHSRNVQIPQMEIIEVAKLKQELENSKTSLAESAVALAQSQQELARTLEHVKSLEKSLDDVKALNENVRRESETKDRRMCQILLESNASEQELQTNLQSERQQHEEAVKNYEKQLQTAMEDITKLKEKLEEASLQPKNGEFGQLQDKVNQLDNEKVSLNETILELELKVSSLTSQNEKYHNEVISAQKKLSEHDETVRVKDDEISSSNAIIEKLQSELHLQENLLMAEAEKFRQESERFKIDREVFERMEKEIKSRLHDKEEQIAALKQDKVNAQGESQKNSEFLELTAVHTQLNNDYELLKTEMANLMKESGLQKSTIEEIVSQNSTLLKERESLLQEISHLKDEMQTVVTKTNSEKQQQVEEDRIQFLRKIESITEQNAQLLADKVRLNAEYSKEKTSIIANHSSEVTSLKSQMIDLEKQLEQLQSKYTNELKKTKEDLSLVESERTELLRTVQMKHTESINYQTEVMRLNEVLKAEKIKIENAIAEKAQMEFKCQSLKKLEERVVNYEKQVATLETECQNLRDQLGYASELLKETKRQEAEGRCDTPPPNVVCPNGCAQTQEELNKLAWSLHTEQANSKTLKTQIAEYKDKVEKTETQLARLQAHLVELEATQTEELVKAQETVTELRARLDAAEERARASSTACTSANIRANQQVECLTQQVKLLTDQKEKLEAEVSGAEDASLKQQAAITNLQAVLHQFQLDKQRDIEFETERIRQKLNEAYKKNEDQALEMKQILDQLNEANKGLSAATHLSEQLNKKSEIVANLQAEVTILKEKLKKEEEKLKSLSSNTEGKVDKNLVKNLVVGYICASDNSKGQVLRVLSSVLELAKEERARIGLEPTSSAQQQSLSQAFIKFLESESQPKPHIVLSVPPTPEGPSRRTSQTSISGGSGSILMSEGIQTMGPSLVRSGSILKDVLKEPHDS